MTDEAYNTSVDDQGENVQNQNQNNLNTGAIDEEQVEEITFSDLLDLSDVEEMDVFADELDPFNLPQLVDADGLEMAKYTKDADIFDDFMNRQEINSGTEQLISDLKNHTGQSPETSANDIDASWDIDIQSGEESVGASVATPEQNVVSELGEALGLQYNDDEALNTEEKIAARDENRWELSVESMMDEEFNEEDFEIDENAVEESDLFDELMLDGGNEDDMG